jgi:glycerophosphoryl diester phosphodiesterase
MPSSRLAPLFSLQIPAVIAHRGGGGLRPENTRAAFAHAASLGVDAVECDVHVARDGEPVVIHDDTLDRTTDATGPVASRTAEELAEVDAGYRFGPQLGHPFRGQRIGVPRLVDALRDMPAMPFVIEIKGHRPADAAVVLEAIRRAGAEDRVILGGFSLPVLAAVRALAPGVPTSAARDEVRSALRRAWFGWRPKRPAFDLFQVPHWLRGRQILRPRFVQAARRAGLPVQVWVVDDPDEMRLLLDWGVSGLISDRPDAAIEVIGARRNRPR